MQQDAVYILTELKSDAAVPLPKTNEPPARIRIQDVTPQVDCGRYAVKRTEGDRVDVTATIFRDGHEQLGAAVRYKPAGATRWQEAPLQSLGNDRWAGSFAVDRCGTWCYRVEAWVDRLASFLTSIGPNTVTACAGAGVKSLGFTAAVASPLIAG